MTIKLNRTGISNAKSLINNGKVDKESSWSFSASDWPEKSEEYSKWFLAYDSEKDRDTKEAWKFPFGKNGKVYRSGVIAAKQRAAQYGYDNVVATADTLLSLIDGKSVSAVVSMGAFSELAKAGVIESGEDVSVFHDVECKIEKGDDGGPVKIVITTEHIDRDKDIVKVDGWDFSNYMKNPVVLWGHDSRSLPIGRALSLERSNVSGVPGIVANVEFTPKDVYEFGARVGKMVESDFVRAASVGFKPIKWEYDEDRRGYDINEAELFEFSMVSVPANPHAVTINSSFDVWAGKAYGATTVTDYEIVTRDNTSDVVDWCRNTTDGDSECEKSVDTVDNIKESNENDNREEDNMVRLEFSFTEEQFKELSDGSEINFKFGEDGDVTVAIVKEKEVEIEEKNEEDEVDIEKLTELINEAVKDAVADVALELTGKLPEEE